MRGGTPPLRAEGRFVLRASPASRPLASSRYSSPSSALRRSSLRSSPFPLGSSLGSPQRSPSLAFSAPSFASPFRVVALSLASDLSLVRGVGVVFGACDRSREVLGERADAIEGDGRQGGVLVSVCL